MESLDMNPFPLIWVWQMTKKINVSVEVPCLEGSLALLLALEERKSRDHTKGLLLTSSLRPLCHPCIPVTFYDLLTLTSSTGQGLVWPVMSFIFEIDTINVNIQLFVYLLIYSYHLFRNEGGNGETGIFILTLFDLYFLNGGPMFYFQNLIKLFSRITRHYIILVQ